MKPSEILDAAANKLDRDGWAQNGFGTGWLGAPTPTCALGAILAVTAKACSDRALERSAHKAETAFELSITPCPPQRNPIPYWNDAQGRTKEEVIAMLRAVAMTERAREARLMPVLREPVPA